jgi:hypothetical protein
MPPVVTWQSVIDSTVGSAPTVDVLYARLSGAQHRLVIFDVNRSVRLASVQQPGARELIERVARGDRQHTFELVANTSPETLDSTAGRARLPGPRRALPSRPTTRSTVRPGSGRAGIPSLGSWLLRGESGALTVSLGSLTRVRSNPFFSLIERQIEEMAAADVKSTAAIPSPAAH